MRIATFTETFVPAVNGVVTRLGHTISRLTGRGDQVLLVAPDGGVADFRGAHVVPVPNLPLPMYPEAVISVPSPDVGHDLPPAEAVQVLDAIVELARS